MMGLLGAAGLLPLATSLAMTALRRGCGSPLSGVLSSFLLDPVTPEIIDHGGWGTACYPITLGTCNVCISSVARWMRLLAWEEVVL